MPGIWLGKKFQSDEHMVGIEDGSVSVTSSVRLLPDSESWSVDLVNNEQDYWYPALSQGKRTRKRRRHASRSNHSWQPAGRWTYSTSEAS